MKPHEHNRAFISEIILILVALIFLKYYFNFDIIAWIKSPGPQQIIQSVWNWCKALYEKIPSYKSH